MTRTIIPILVLFAPLIVAGCASSPDHPAWVNEASSTECTVVPERESTRRVHVAAYEHRRAMGGQYTAGPFWFYYRLGPTVYRW